MKDLVTSVLTHARNKDIEFFEDNHEYYYKKDVKFDGITSLLKEYTPYVDWDEKAKKKAAKLGIDPVELRNSWKEKGAETALKGSLIHKSIEDYINRFTWDSEYQFHLDAFVTSMINHGIEPFVCEWCIYDERIKRASMVDIVGIKNDKLVIVDTKTMQDRIPKHPFTKGETFLYPWVTIPNSKYHKFCLQINFYKYWIEHLYDLPVSDEMYIFHINDTMYDMIPVENLQSEIKDFYEFTFS